MASGFRSTRKGIVASFDSGERDLLSRLFLDCAQLLEGGLPQDADPLAAIVGISSDAQVPDDPAVARLLPVATTGDDELAAEFRRFTEIGLRQRKATNLRTSAESLASGHGADVVLDHEVAVAWLTALTDVRLVLAERLGIHTDEDAEALYALVEDDADDPKAWMAAVYDFLTWLQETLVAAVSRSRR